MNEISQANGNDEDIFRNNIYKNPMILTCKNKCTNNNSQSIDNSDKVDSDEDLFDSNDDDEIKSENNDYSQTNKWPLLKVEKDSPEKNRLAISQEYIDHVYFKHSMESPSMCVNRINSLISEYHKKLKTYQNNRIFHSKWGLPIVVHKQLKEGLLKNSFVNNKTSVRQVRNLNVKDIEDPYHYSSSSDPENIESKKSDSDEEWSLFETKPKKRKVYRNKLSRQRDKKTNDKKNSEVPAVVLVDDDIKSNNSDKQSVLNSYIDPLSSQNTDGAIDLCSSQNSDNIEMCDSPIDDTCNFDLFNENNDVKLEQKSIRKSFQLGNTDINVGKNEPYDTTEKEASNKFDTCNSLKRPLDEGETKPVKRKSPMIEKLDDSSTGDIVTDSQENKQDLDDVKLNSSYQHSIDKQNFGKNDEGNEVGLIASCSTDSSSDITIVSDIECPMCNKMFPPQEVEVHAYDCQGPSDVIVDDCDIWSNGRLRQNPRKK